MMVPLGERLPPDFAVPPLERGRVAGPYALPAGRYVVRVWLDEMALGDSVRQTRSGSRTTEAQAFSGADRLRVSTPSRSSSTSR